MESLKDKITAFIEHSGNGSGFGYGRGAGYALDSGYGSGSGFDSGYDSDSGYGSGIGFGSGFGFCDGFGHGRGSGDGDGSGSGYGSSYDSGYDIKSFCGEEVHYIDGLPTIIRALRGNVARGLMIGEDLTTSVCYVVKQDNVFAHGATLKKAVAALRGKLFLNMPEENRIEAFMAEHQPGVKYPAADLYDWHHKLTGSCEAGRQQFAKDRGIDIDHDMLTVEEFIELTRDAYGGDVIRKLAKFA